MPHFTESPDAARIGNALIGEFHGHLNGAQIRYLFSDAKPSGRGCKILATAKKLNDLERYLASESGDQEDGPELAILINQQLWSGLHSAARRAAIDHELSHFVEEENEKTGDVTIVYAEHDVEEFTHILARHGAWHPNLEDFTRQARQLALPNGQGAAERVASTIADAVERVQRGEPSGLSGAASDALEQLVSQGATITVGTRELEPAR